MAMGMCWSMTMIKLSELTCFLWLSFVDFWFFCMVIVLEFFPFPKIFPNGITKISTCCSPFCVTCPMVEFLLVILCLENLLPRSLANGCVLCYWVLLACLDILFQRQSLSHHCKNPTSGRIFTFDMATLVPTHISVCES
jgi:hypothetical protein